MQIYSGKLFHLWRFLGLAPMKIQNNKPIVSIKYICYNIFLMCLTVIFVCYPIYLELNSSIKVRMTTMTARVGCVLDHLSTLLACLTAIMFNTVYSNDTTKLMNIVHNVDKMIDTKIYKSKFMTCLVLYVMLFLLTVIIDLINWYYMTPNSIIYAPSYFLHVVVFGAQFGYIDIVLQIKRRFASLNLILRESLKTEAHFGTTLDTRKCIRVFRMMVSDGGMIGFTHVHWLLCDVIRQVNNCFGYQILLVMLAILVHIIITPYFFLLGIAYPSHNADRNLFYLVTQAMWTCVHAMQLIIITWCCSTTTDMANETAPLMSKCLMGNLDDISQKEMEGCIVQLLHHRAAFSACGLFDINLPIITAVTGAVTTYLVILIQFQNADTGDN